MYCAMAFLMFFLPALCQAVWNDVELPSKHPLYNFGKDSTVSRCFDSSKMKRVAGVCDCLLDLYLCTITNTKNTLLWKAMKQIFSSGCSPDASCLDQNQRNWACLLKGIERVWHVFPSYYFHILCLHHQFLNFCIA